MGRKVKPAHCPGDGGQRAGLPPAEAGSSIIRDGSTCSALTIACAWPPGQGRTDARKARSAPLFPPRPTNAPTGFSGPGDEIGLPSSRAVVCWPACRLRNPNHHSNSISHSRMARVRSNRLLHALEYPEPTAARRRRRQHRTRHCIFGRRRTVWHCLSTAALVRAICRPLRCDRSRTRAAADTRPTCARDRRRSQSWLRRARGRRWRVDRTGCCRLGREPAVEALKQGGPVWYPLGKPRGIFR